MPVIVRRANSTEDLMMNENTSMFRDKSEIFGINVLPSFNITQTRREIVRQMRIGHRNRPIHIYIEGPTNPLGGKCDLKHLPHHLVDSNSRRIEDVEEYENEDNRIKDKSLWRLYGIPGTTWSKPPILHLRILCLWRIEETRNKFRVLEANDAFIDTAWEEKPLPDNPGLIRAPPNRSLVDHRVVRRLLRYGEWVGGPLPLLPMLPDGAAGVRTP